MTLNFSSNIRKTEIRMILKHCFMKMHLYEKLKKCTFVLKNRKNAEEGKKET